MQNVVALAYKGDPTALYLLASMFFDGTDAVLQDKRTASKLFLIAANAGSSDAEFRLASMYLAGDGIRKSDDDGIYFLRRAAEHGIPLAQFGLGSMFAAGVAETKESTITIPQDSVAAYMWFSLCADVEQQCETARNGLTGKMTAPQIHDAIEASKQWKSEHYRDRERGK